jgi:hypothetical protein
VKSTSVEAVNTRAFFGPDPGGSTEDGLWCIETLGLSHARPLMSLLSVRILHSCIDLLRPKIATLVAIVSNIAHPWGYLQAHCDENSGLLILAGGPAVLRADVGVGIFGGRTIHRVASPGGYEWRNGLKKLCGIQMPG